MQQVRELVAAGHTLREVERLTGISYSTVSRWRNGRTQAFGASVRYAAPPYRPPDPWSYAYLLGVYLGDGCLSRTGRTWTLSLALDAVYPEIVEECATAVQLAALDQRPRTRAGRDRCVRVLCGWKRWIEVFPQHGPGRKHEREIVLAEWQQEVVDAHPEQFLRGLIHSDGCRTVNRFTTRLPSGRVAEYAYPRYFFSNESADIRALFCATCDRLGIRWTQSNRRNVSVSHRDSVARLDAFVGPKR